MRRTRRLLIALTVLACTAAGGPHAAGASPSGAIFFDGSPGAGPPPATLGPYTMTPFPADPNPLNIAVGNVAAPTGGNVLFSPDLEHLRVTQGWATWSHGYRGDVYWTFDALSATLTLPPGTTAFYLYAEPNPFEVFNITAESQDGTSSGPIAVDGDSGAQYFGFYATGGESIATIVVSSTEDFAIGEFGISAPTLKVVALPPSGLHVDDSLSASQAVGAFVDPADTSASVGYEATVDFGAGRSAQPASVVPAGSACPSSLATSSGGACFLILPSAEARKSPYLRAGTFQLRVAVSQPATSRSGSDTAQVSVQNSTYRVDLRAWIPYPIVVDPLNPSPGLLSPAAAVVLGWPTCGAPLGLFVPLPPPVSSPVVVASFLRGDTHAGFAGTYRVETVLQFEWTGTQLVNPQVARNAAISSRWITYALFTRSWTCDMTALATTTTPATGASGTSFQVDYSSATPLVPLAPTIDGSVRGSFAADGTISVDFTTDGFPSHGVAIERNGVSQRVDVLNDASCISQAGVLGVVGLARVGVGLSGAATSTGSFADEPDRTGSSGIVQRSPLC